LANDLWADRFEEDLADLFKLQDQVVARLVNSLGNELFKAEAERGVHSKNPDAIDLTMRGRALLFTAWLDKDKNNAARALFEQALKIDPNNADALAGEAFTYSNEYKTNTGIDYDAKILGLLDRAIALAPDSVRPYEAKADYLFTAGRWDAAIRAAEAGLAINPNSATLYDAKGWPETSSAASSKLNPMCCRQCGSVHAIRT
jgi:tetratricopeptide (TPR) repeat protein